LREPARPARLKILFQVFYFENKFVGHKNALEVWSFIPPNDNWQDDRRRSMNAMPAFQ
jgi:hypothetical protein